MPDIVPPRRLVRRPPSASASQDRLEASRLAEEARQYITLKGQVGEIQGRIRTLRDRLIATVEEAGVEGEKGHQFLDLPGGEIGGFAQLQRERRVSQKLDDEALQAWLREEHPDLYDEVYKPVPVRDDDALAALVFEGKLSNKDLNEFVTTSVTWALKTVKA